MTSQSDNPAERPAGLRARLRLPRTMKGRILAGVTLGVLVAAAVGGGYWYETTHLDDGVVFRVYGQDVTETELDDRVQTTTAMYGVRPPAEGPQLDQFRRDFAKAAAISMIIDKAAADRNIAVADRQVADVLARYITQFYGEGPAGRERYVQALAEQGTSEPKVLAELKRQMTLQRLSSQITSDVTVTDQEVRDAFEQRREQLAIPERREIHNIVVREKREADEIVAALNGGANFEQLAQQRSADTATKDKGGNLGLVSARQLQQPYAQVAFSAPVNTVFGPVRTPYGYNVGKVVAIAPPEPAQFEKVADQLRQMLIREKAVAKWNDFLRAEIEEADVRYADEYRPADPNALPDPRQAAGQPDQAPPAGQAPSAPPAEQAPAPPAGQAPAPPAGQPAAPPAR